MNEDVDSLLNTAATVSEIASSLSSNKTLSAATNDSRITPIARITDEVAAMNQDVLNNLLQTALGVYSSLYMTAVEQYGSIGNVRVATILQKYSTSGGGIAKSANIGVSRLMQATESIGEPACLSDYKISALEARTDDMRSSNIAVGKLLTVPFTCNGQKSEFRVIVRLAPQVISNSKMVELTKALATDTSMAARFHDFRSGKIDLIDYLTCRDLIRQDRKLLATDTTGVYRSNRDKKTKGFFTTLISGGNVNMNLASSIIIITKTLANELEVAMRGRFSDYKSRQKFMEGQMATLLFVVDTDSEMFTMYQDSVDDVGRYTFRDIKDNGSSANALDINALMQTARQNAIPRL